MKHHIKSEFRSTTPQLFGGEITFDLVANKDQEKIAIESFQRIAILYRIFNFTNILEGLNLDQKEVTGMISGVIEKTVINKILHSPRTLFFLAGLSLQDFLPNNLTEINPSLRETVIMEIPLPLPIQFFGRRHINDQRTLKSFVSTMKSRKQEVKEVNRLWKRYETQRQFENLLQEEEQQNRIKAHFKKTTKKCAVQIYPKIQATQIQHSIAKTATQSLSSTHISLSEISQASNQPRSEEADANPFDLTKLHYSSQSTLQQEVSQETSKPKSNGSFEFKE